MAIWQVDVGLLPNEVVNNPPAVVKEVLEKYGLIDMEPWWESHQPPADYRDIISRKFPFFMQGENEWLWGKEGEDCVLIIATVEGGRLLSFWVRFDVRLFNEQSVEDLCEMTKELNCHLYFFESRSVVPPNERDVTPQVMSSGAMQWLSDPDAFFRGKARQPFLTLGDMVENLKKYEWEKGQRKRDA